MFGWKDATFLEKSFQVVLESVAAGPSPWTTVPPPSEAADLNSTPLAFSAACRGGASAAAIESPIHSTFLPVLPCAAEELTPAVFWRGCVLPQAVVATSA